MKRLSILSLVLTSALLLVGCGGSEATRAANMEDTPSKGYIAIAENDINLGTVRMSEGNVDIPFTFKNSGDEPVALIEGTSSCMCTEAVVQRSDGKTSPRIKMPGHGPVARIYQVLEPGEEAKLIATFDPNAHGPQGVGPIVRDIVITTNSKETPKATFRFRGSVIP